MKLSAGTLLQGGKYRIEEHLGSGGFGCTYKAYYRTMRCYVAIKEFFVKDFCNREENGTVKIATQSKMELVERLRDKFLNEARTLFNTKMHHPNIVRVTDVFEENGTVYYAMDYIEGSSLAGLIAQKGCLSESEALGYIKQIAAALKHLHANNCLHLDIKPANIMIDADGKATLIDFGVSKQYDEVNGENTSTLLGHTPGYAPIEQSGRGMIKFNAACDIYALGATLYKALTGTTPVDATLRAGDKSLCNLSYPEHVSPAMRNVIDKSMQISRSDRPQSVEEFLRLVESGKMRVESEETEVASDETSLSMGRGQNAANGNAAADEQEDIAVEVVELPSVTQEPAPRPQPEENQKKSKWLWIIILLAVICGAAGGFMFLGGGGNVNPNANNTAVAKNAELIIEGAPDSANVYVDGSFIGKTPLERKTVPLGEHTIKIEKECYETYEKQHTFNNSNTPVTVKATLEFATHTFKANGVEFTMVAVEGGTFSMGSNDGDSSEKPVHQVTLDSYFIGETEVTQALWQAVMGTTIHDQAKKGSDFKKLWGTGDNNPMYYLSYNDCLDFVNQLNTLLKDQLPQGRQFRLPTEAEWEFAARGGNKSKGYKYSGSNSISTVAWYEDNSGGTTHPVKQKASNELGLYDMNGNVYEWCSDYYSSNYYSSSPQNNPKGPGSGSYRVNRGGYWDCYVGDCRLAYRHMFESDDRYPAYGLRLAF